MNTTTKMILGLTVAAAAGAAIGMLMAPEKGADLQKKIKDETQDWLNNFSDLFATGKDLISQVKSTVEDKLNESHFYHDINENVSKISKN